MITVYHSTARERKLTAIPESRIGSWCHVVEPTDTELDEIAERFGLDRDLLADATDIYEAPRVEVDEGVTYVFTRYSNEDGQDVSTEPLLIVYTNSNIVTIMRNNGPVLDQLINGRIEVITTQKTKTFLQLLVQVNRSYRLKLNQVSKYILRTRRELRRSQVDNKDLIGFIELEEDINEFISALQPQALVINALESGKYMRLYEDDRDLVEDLNLSTSELIELSKTRLRTLMNMRQAYDAIATNNLNRTFKRLTSIAIFLTIPTIISGIWGMNVLVPLHSNGYAFWIILGLIALLIAAAVTFFRKQRWLE
jgi:magnesium transporter